MNLKNLAEDANKIAEYIKTINGTGRCATRSDLNIVFKASSDKKKTERLSALLLNLLQYGWLHHYADPDYPTIYFWCSNKLSDFKSPHQAKTLAQREKNYPDLLALYLDPTCLKITSLKNPDISAATNSNDEIVHAKNNDVMVENLTKALAEQATKINAARMVSATETKPSAKKTETKVQSNFKTLLQTNGFNPLHLEYSSKIAPKKILENLIASRIDTKNYQNSPRNQYQILKLVSLLKNATITTLSKTLRRLGMSNVTFINEMEKMDGSSLTFSILEDTVSLTAEGTAKIRRYEFERIDTDLQSASAMASLSEDVEFASYLIDRKNIVGSVMALINSLSVQDKEKVTKLIKEAV